MLSIGISPWARAAEEVFRKHGYEPCGVGSQHFDHRCLCASRKRVRSLPRRFRPKISSASRITTALVPMRWRRMELDRSDDRAISTGSAYKDVVAAVPR